ncbi:hypothetical protein [Megamonas hypermegale]|uniref:hypothetical protein n=1 Tax=Megamonas hypermegale TaxID=158847 RepID=UPI00195BD73D|nr:hypothetical protein [Megamonas hypermegale]MBM6833102.1 hypothetical protein [Megamonas hypermegale]
MIKLFRRFAIFFAILALFAGYAMPISKTEAAPLFTVQSYWNGDTNYPLAFAQGTTNRYVDLSSAKLEEKTTDEAGITTAIFTFKVVMVNNGEMVNTYDYKTMIKVGGEELLVAAQRANNTSWSQITSSSFNQPQYNATLILADHFGIQ